MKKTKKFQNWALLFLLCALMSGCVNKDYDFDEDIDATMGLGANGLTLKVGNTEKMYLRDLLKVEDSEMLDTLKTGTKQCLYYLVKGGNSNFNVEVKDINPFQIEKVNIVTTPVATNTTGADIPLSSAVQYTEDVSGISTMSVKIEDISSDIKEISKITMENTSLVITYALNSNDFALTKATGFSLTFPDDIVIKNESGEDSHVYNVQNLSGRIEVPISYIQLKKSGTGAKFGQVVENGKVSVSENIAVSGNFTIQGKNGSMFSKGESVKLDVAVSFPSIRPKKISGLVAPDISATVDPIQISNDLPDFLQDESVELHVANPTMRFDVQGTQIPMPLLMSAGLNSVKANSTIASVRVPEGTAQAGIASQTNSVLYFYQGTKPFDPNEAANYSGYKVSNLGNLITKLPDAINVDLSTGHITTDQSVEHTLTLGQTYAASVDYQALIPFSFEANTQIVYSDSCDNMNKDMKKYQADGLTVTATAENTIPLDLTVELIPKDVNGNVISGIEIGTAVAAAGAKDTPKMTPLSITLKANNPADVSKLDKIEFKIYCKSVSADELYSNQYIQMKEIRIKLNGKIVGDFN